MSIVVTRGLRRQLKLEVPQQHVHEAIQSHEQPPFQAKGIQPIDAPNNELQQPITTYLLHQILAK
jgi:hypothetical protein